MHHELIETIDNSVENAKFLLKKTQCKQALLNYEVVLNMHRLILLQDELNNNLLDMCTDAAQRCRNYVTILKTAEDYISPKMWAKILDEAARKSNCSCEGGDAL